MACGKEKQNRKADTKNMSDKVLEVNVDDLYLGGVFSLVKNVVKNKPKDMQIDIAAIESLRIKKIYKVLKNVVQRYTMWDMMEISGLSNSFVFFI